MFFVLFFCSVLIINEAQMILHPCILLFCFSHALIFMRMNSWGAYCILFYIQLALLEISVYSVFVWPDGWGDACSGGTIFFFQLWAFCLDARSPTEKTFQSAAELNRKMHQFFKATRSVFYVCSADSDNPVDLWNQL